MCGSIGGPCRSVLVVMLLVANIDGSVRVHWMLLLSSSSITAMISK